MCFSFLRFTAWVTIETLRVLTCLADRRWGREERGEEGPICDDVDDADVEGMEAAMKASAPREGAPLLLQRRVLDADAAAARDAPQLP